MAYQSLYRTYRPQRFSELVGQDHVVNALRSAVRDGRVGHAYLFSGPRGTGKTTSARILAKALNCLDLGADGDPCGECENCRAIANGTFFDLIELDAASSGNIASIQDIIEKTHTGLAPASRRKVFVIDEVHALGGGSSKTAPNALLKTLEEAPDHVVFVLATTNPENVLPTIRSRTQHFEFTLLTTDELVAHLADICARENVEADAEALSIIATAAAGSARDALSLLDQALAHDRAHLDGATVAELFGGTAYESRIEILNAIASEDTAGVLITLAGLLDTGHDPRRVAEDLLRATRDVFILNAAGDRIAVAAPSEDHERLRALAGTLGNATLVRIIETLGEAVTDMRGMEAADPRLVLEVALVRLARRDAGPPLQMVIERLERLERGEGAAAGEVRPPIKMPTRESRAATTPEVVAKPETKPETASPEPEPEPEPKPEPVPASPEPEPEPETKPETVSPEPETKPAPASPDQETAAPEPAPASPDQETAAPEPAPAPDAKSGRVPRPTLGALRRDSAANPPPPPLLKKVVVEPEPEPEPELVIDPNAPVPELAAVIEAWAQIVPELPPATRGAISGAQPIRIDDNVLIFGVAPELLVAAKPRFKGTAEKVRTALAQQLGFNFQFLLEAADHLSTAEPSVSIETITEDEETIDISDTVSAPDENPDSLMHLLERELGATVVEEVSNKEK